MECKYVCTRTISIDDKRTTTDSLWIIDGRMVIHTMTIENSSQDVIEESATSDIDMTKLEYPIQSVCV